ncbi:MAG: hypothetical protein NVS4B13_07260 [Candidatus Elarobacter sp.]
MTGDRGQAVSIEDVDYDDLEALWNAIEPDLVALPTLQEVAQRFTGALYERFAGSIVLTRTFATTELRTLPPADREFVEGFARANGLAGELTESTPVLSLLGTRGVEPEWDDRRRSRGHLGIPLPSHGFVRDIPMIARLLQEIGFTPAWAGLNSGFVTKTLANLNGIFYVGDARTAQDELGRNIIPAMDFVQRYQVRTVFGFGGSYLSGNTFIATIVFCRDEISRREAMKFVPLIGLLKAATTRLVRRNAVFSA